jgi:hypothetical protein
MTRRSTERAIRHPLQPFLDRFIMGITGGALK